MNWIEHEYLVPIFIGNSEKNMRERKRVKKLTSLKPHIFASKFTLMQRMSYSCHYVNPMRPEFLTESLLSFAGTLEGYMCPVIFICDRDCEEILEECGESIDAAYIKSYI